MDHELAAIFKSPSHWNRLLGEVIIGAWKKKNGIWEEEEEELVLERFGGGTEGMADCGLREGDWAS